MDKQDLILKENPTLGDFQDYIKKIKSIRGFKNDPNKSFILLNKEIGELAQAFRLAWADEKLTDEEKKTLGQELADVFFYILDIANLFNVTLEQSFREREKINKTRDWQQYHFY